MNPDFESSLETPAREILHAALGAEEGNIIFTAPTGAGKTTAMASALLRRSQKHPPAVRRRNKPSRN